ncbi:hypothetical protein L226DRAFT_98022 [Lentinus tigrinus ALCF2SS1-7]|uniref:uncharacterized protein n=1 Tax=Lentinus tigrinus ALCF2SS1-7 TaxID=1328758 RepID=UPI001165C9F2|nr:hypothetical protein L226DRAFT_98022 [Lentinus tigrinus ALCF2SS1-7]
MTSSSGFEVAFMMQRATRRSSERRYSRRTLRRARKAPPVCTNILHVLPNTLFNRVRNTKRTRWQACGCSYDEIELRDTDLQLLKWGMHDAFGESY